MQILNITVTPATRPEDSGLPFTFTISRNSTSELANPLTVNLAVSGTATFATDYTQSGAATFTTTTASVIISATQLSANVVISPTADAVTEPNETIILTIIPTVGVSLLGVNSAATATIIDDDNTTLLTYASNGDTNGLFYWLGTNKGTTSWSNPSGQLSYSASIASPPFANYSSLTNRIVDSHPGNTWIEGAWLRVDLGANLRIRPSYISVRSWINNDRLPRNFKIQGSNDGTTFDDLLTVTGDTTITGNSQWLSLAITTPATAYRYLRYLCTSPGSSNNAIEVALGEWEFYGIVSQL
jgi:hypothetical protein